MRVMVLAALIAVSVAMPLAAAAQPGTSPSGSIGGRVTDAANQPMAGAAVSVEGTRLGALADSAGLFRISRVPAGPQVLRAQRIGYAPTRINITVPVSGSLVRDVVLVRNALELKGIEITADPTSRARGELGTASVIELEAIRNQTAASLAGILELVPGVPLQTPGLDNVQQISLRSVPVSGGDANSAGSPSAENLAAFGTLIILDGVPISNNANLQSLGSRAELSFSSSAGGGIDLRRIPATTIERVEVIRGVPSVRYGDLTQGAIIVDTKAGAVEPALAFRLDARTIESSFAGGRQLGARQTATITANIARTRVQTGRTDNQSTRFAAQLAHRALFGRAQDAGDDSDPASRARLVLDTRADAYQLLDNRPETPTFPGYEARARDVGLRVSERMRLLLGAESRLEITGAFEAGQQRAFTRGDVLRGTTPITSRTSAGRATGRFSGGVFNARVDVDGEPTLYYARAELTSPRDLVGLSHEFKLGTEFRREANTGAGYQFDIEFPPETRFNGVRGFSRPRSFESIPPLATSAIYLDDRVSRTLFGGMLLNVQLGVRADVLHEGSTWFSGKRDAVIQPRINAELAPTPWFRLRAGVGRMAKLPSLLDLSPAPSFYDVVNVSFFANNPAERLAVLTTFVVDPANPQLGYSIADKAEAGFEMRLGSGGANLGVVGFKDRIQGGVGIRAEASFIQRDRFGLTNTTPGSGRPPILVEPPLSADSVPIIVDRPANNLTQTASGFEMTATFPEIPALRTRFNIQGALVKSRLEKDGIEFAASFPTFQVSENQPRAPYYDGLVRTGERLLVTTRVIHHQPALGLILTGTIQHTLREITQDFGGTDTLAFAGYITRGGSLVPVPPAERGQPQYSDIRIPRRGTLTAPREGAVDWLFSFQVSKTLPLDGRLSFYAFNAFDRIGHYGSNTVATRVYPPARFGLEVTMPLGRLFQ